MAHKIAPEAEQDLDDIWLYVARQSGSMELADRTVDAIAARFYLLTQHPHLGRRRDDDLAPGLRSFLSGSFLIIYRVEGDATLILRVVRGSMDIEALFRN